MTTLKTKPPKNPTPENKQRAYNLVQDSWGMRSPAHQESYSVRQTRFTNDRQLVALLRSVATKPAFIETTKGKKHILNVHRWYVLALELSGEPTPSVTGIIYDVLAKDATDAATLYQRMSRTPLDSPEAREMLDAEVDARNTLDR